MFKKYKATRENVILLEKAMKALGYEVEKVKAEKDYKAFKDSNWHNMFSTTINDKMQELEKANN
ncbi:hypothetical protein P9265_14760 [Schinkia azotoformans]|uniref:hypothetical protein n=1 Tax=Schinkia azotoformans TaxID=1454 RepID=UPI002E1D2DA3|nr:hypothetical protein [Schinkia azotoformans]